MLLSLGVAVLVAPACRLGYEELDTTDGMLSGGDSSGTGGSADTGGTATGGAGDTDTGGSATGGIGGTSSSAGGDAGGGTPVGGDGSGGQPPACADTADCTCDALDGHDYLFCRQSIGRDDANAYCQTNGMTLVRIDNATENNFVLTKGTAYSVFVTPQFFAYIGANDQAVVGEWRWVDGTLFWQGGTGGTLVPGTYANWDNKSPSTMSVQRCSGMLATGLWQDRSCTALTPFICESP